MTPLSISEPKSAKGLANQTIWDAGYKVCIDIYRTADLMKDQVAAEQLKKITIPFLLDVSKRGSSKMTPSSIKRMRQQYIQIQKISTLLMFTHDLNQIESNRYIELNSNLNYLLMKLKKIIKYGERKLEKAK